MEKINTITDEQKAEMPKYVEKWIAKGCATHRLNFNHTKKIVNDFRNLINLPSADLVIVENPLEAFVCCCLIEYGVAKENLMEEMNKVFDKKSTYKMSKPFLPYQTNTYFCSTFGFYDYMFNCLGVKLTPELKAKYEVWEKTSEINAIYPLKTISIVSQHPTAVHLVKSEQNANRWVLHNESGPALEYAGRGGFQLYSLRGVSVPSWMVLTPSHELTLQDYNKLKNADQKAEFIRKVGIEKFLESGKVVDTFENYPEKKFPWWHKSQYQLIDMKSIFPNLTYAPYLKMLNQTTDIWHMEGVSPNCRTLSDALKERFGGAEFEIAGIS